MKSFCNFSPNHALDACDAIDMALYDNAAMLDCRLMSDHTDPAARYRLHVLHASSCFADHDTTEPCWYPHDLSGASTGSILNSGCGNARHARDGMLFGALILFLSCALIVEFR